MHVIAPDHECQYTPGLPRVTSGGRRLPTHTSATPATVQSPCYAAPVCGAPLNSTAFSENASTNLASGGVRMGSWGWDSSPPEDLASQPYRVTARKSPLLTMGRACGKAAAALTVLMMADGSWGDGTLPGNVYDDEAAFAAGLDSEFPAEFEDYLSEPAMVEATHAGLHGPNTAMPTGLLSASVADAEADDSQIAAAAAWLGNLAFGATTDPPAPDPVMRLIGTRFRTDDGYCCKNRCVHSIRALDERVVGGSAHAEAIHSECTDLRRTRGGSAVAQTDRSSAADAMYSASSSQKPSGEAGKRSLDVQRKEVIGAHLRDSLRDVCTNAKEALCCCRRGMFYSGEEALVGRLGLRVRSSSVAHIRPVDDRLAADIRAATGMYPKSDWSTDLLVKDLQRRRAAYDEEDRLGRRIHLYESMVTADGTLTSLPNEYYALLYGVNTATMAPIRRAAANRSTAEIDADASTRFSSVKFGAAVDELIQEEDKRAGGANALPKPIQAVIVNHCELYTRTEPVSRRKGAIAFVYCDPEVNGLTGLHLRVCDSLTEMERCGLIDSDLLDKGKHYHDGVFQPALLVKFPTFCRWVRRWVRAQGKKEGLHGYLLPFSSDHNCCPVCMTLRKNVDECSMALTYAKRALSCFTDGGIASIAALPSDSLRNWARNCDLATDAASTEDLMAAATTAVAAAESALAEAKAARAEHIELDRAIRRVYRQFADCGARLNVAERVLRGGDATGAYDCPRPCSVESSSTNHSDDATKQSWPRSIWQGVRDGLAKFEQSLNGFYFRANDRFVLNLPELGVGSKDSGFTIETILSALALGLNGEKVIVIALDGASTNFTSTLACVLPQLLCESGICESCHVVYFQKYHSKDFCDKMFGANTSLQRTHGVSQMEDFGKLCSHVMKRLNGRSDAIVSNPDAMSAHYTHACAEYNLPMLGWEALGTHFAGYSRVNTVTDPELCALVETYCKPGSGKTQLSRRPNPITKAADGTWAAGSWDDGDVTMFELQRKAGRPPVANPPPRMDTGTFDSQAAAAEQAQEQAQIATLRTAAVGNERETAYGGSGLDGIAQARYDRLVVARAHTVAESAYAADGKYASVPGSNGQLMVPVDPTAPAGSITAALLRRHATAVARLTAPALAELGKQVHARAAHKPPRKKAGQDRPAPPALVEATLAAELGNATHQRAWKAATQSCTDLESYVDDLDWSRLKYLISVVDETQAVAYQSGNAKARAGRVVRRMGYRGSAVQHHPAVLELKARGIWNVNARNRSSTPGSKEGCMPSKAAQELGHRGYKLTKMAGNVWRFIFLRFPASLFPDGWTPADKTCAGRNWLFRTAYDPVTGLTARHPTRWMYAATHNVDSVALGRGTLSPDSTPTFVNDPAGEPTMFTPAMPTPDVGTVFRRNAAAFNKWVTENRRPEDPVRQTEFFRFCLGGGPDALVPGGTAEVTWDDLIAGKRTSWYVPP